jgi:hypothetical protein
MRMCVCMHSCFIEIHLIWNLEDGLLISEVVLSQTSPRSTHITTDGRPKTLNTKPQAKLNIIKDGRLLR